MDQPRFEALAERWARLARSSPRAYRWRVYALAALGFASLVMLVLTLLALLALSVAITTRAIAAVKLVLVIGALLLVVLRALWVRLPTPEGQPVTRSAAPQLFALLERLRERLDTPAVHRVLVTADFNAGVTQVPRLGVFGWHRNYLLLGLPLMRCLSAAQLEAVLAHELGHLSRGHARVGNWIYRLRLSWYRLDQALEKKPQWGSGAIRRLLHWYVPYFNACSYPLARSNEFEADAASAQLTSRETVAQALTNISVMAAYLQERYWPGIRAASRDTPQPAVSPFSGFVAPAPADLSGADTRRWLGGALARPTTYSDSHPCLKERLQALGAEPQIALPAAGAAADGLLGQQSASLANTFDAHWRLRVQPSWEKAYQNTQKSRARVAELRGRAAGAGLATPESIELADLEEHVGDGAARALALRRALIVSDPDSDVARFALARQLLSQDDAAGVALMEAVIDRQPDAIVAGSELLRDYCWRRGETDGARRWHERAVAGAQQLQAAKRERERLGPSDFWLPHGLDAAALQALIARLKQIQDLREAYLVRKRVTHRPEVPLYLLGFSATRFGFTGDARTRAVMEQLRKLTEFPGETVIVNIGSGHERFARRFRATAGSRIL
jgi:Zn-dependent protease with chaperone function